MSNTAALEVTAMIKAMNRITIGELLVSSTKFVPRDIVNLPKHVKESGADQAALYQRQTPIIAAPKVTAMMTISIVIIIKAKLANPIRNASGANAFAMMAWSIVMENVSILTATARVVQKASVMMTIYKARILKG